MEYNYQNSIDGFRVEYTLVMEEETPSGYQFTEKESIFLKKLEDAYDDIERLTSQADGYDYALAVSSGILAGLIDSFFVGEWDFKNAKKWSNKVVNKRIMDFAKMDPQYMPWCRGVGKTSKWKQRDSNRLASAVEFLEKKYKLPGDNDWNFKGSGISASSHHLDDFCHHPTPIGMMCCILIQFTGIAKYQSSAGAVINAPVTVNEYGNFVSDKTYGKVFAGIINWFFIVAQTLQNRKGHLMSDMAGSISSVKERKAGAGVPGTVISTLKELSALPCFKDSSFAENLRKAYQNGIGNTGNKLDLGIFNNLFEGAVSRFDIRTEMAVGHELKKQSVPVVINEIIVRAFYFVRRFIEQMKDKQSLMELEWSKLLPTNNRTIVRMMTVSSGVFCVVDMGDAAIRAGLKSQGAVPIFFGKFILRVNFVGIGRFTAAVGSDLYMKAKKTRMEIAVASGEVGATAIKTKQVIAVTSEINNETYKKLDKLKSISADMNKTLYFEPANKKSIGRSEIMIEFDAELMTEEDLKEAACEIFNAQEQDFEKIKYEKWYQTFFHAITLNQDGQNYAVRGVRSLAKLQQLFMNIYIKNYRETNEQLNAIIDAIIQDKKDIKELYFRFLGFEKRKDLKDLEPQDAALLVLFLSKYVDSDDNAPERIGEYNTGVRLALRKNGLGENYRVSLNKLSELRAPEVIYRCFMEQCAIDGTIDSQDWPDSINPLLDDLKLSNTEKNKIKEEVKLEWKTTTADYFINKYSCEYDAGEMFTDADFVVDVNTEDADFKNPASENGYENAAMGTRNHKDDGTNQNKDLSGLNIDHAEKYVKILKILHEGGKQRNAVLKVINRESNFNVKVPAIGGPVFWTNIVKYKGWRLQQNNITHHVRILDPHNVRVAWGTISNMYQALDRLLESF